VSIFRRYAEDLLPLVPTVLRKFPENIINLALRVQFEAMDAVAEALEDYVDAWPIDTAPAWLLDAHWLPYHNLQRNGMTDAEARQHIHAKRLLNKSWGSGEQALQILAVLLPTATLVFNYLPPKAWTVTILAADMAEAAGALAFMEKKASPLGGGFSVAGDNGMAVVQDDEVLSYESAYAGPLKISGWYTSVYGDPGSDTAGHAHVAAI
jgi:hypothetical protein